MIEYILYGTKQGDPDYMETVITVSKNEHDNKFKLASEWAKNNGFDRLHITKCDLGKKPDFVGTVNI